MKKETRPYRYRPINAQGNYIMDVTGLYLNNLELPICTNTLQHWCRVSYIPKTEPLIIIAAYLSNSDGQSIDHHLIQLLQRDPRYQKKINAQIRINKIC